MLVQNSNVISKWVTGRFPKIGHIKLKYFMSVKTLEEQKLKQQPTAVKELKLDDIKKMITQPSQSSPLNTSKIKHSSKLSRSTQQIQNKLGTPIQLEINLEPTRPNFYIDKHASVKKLKNEKDYLQNRINEYEKEIKYLKRKLQMMEQDIIDQDEQLQYSKELIQQLRGEIHDLKQFMKSDKTENILQQAKLNEAILQSLMSKSDLDYLKKLVALKKDDQGIYLKIDPRPLRIGEDGLLTWVNNIPMVTKSFSPSQQLQWMMNTSVQFSSFQSPTLFHRTQAKFDKTIRLKTDPTKQYNLKSPRQQCLVGQKYEF